MSTALLLSMLFGGGSPEIFSKADFKQVQRVIADPARTESAQETMQRINTQLESLITERVRHFEELREIDADFDAPVAEFEAIFDELWDARRTAATIYTKEVFVLRDSITRDEWHSVFADASQE